MSKLVSVILPNYNHEAFLQERLDSIFNQTYQNYEVIILDDCSTDNSLKILDRYKYHTKVSHFIVNTTNSGSPFKQWKKGLDLAQGDYIWIAESDDFCDFNFLESQLDYLKNVDVTVSETLTYCKGIKPKEVLHPLFKTGESQVLTNDTILNCPILNVSAVVFKAVDREQLKKCFFNEFNIIGDRVFYHEFFYNRSFTLNRESTSYFRKDGSGLSDLSSKDSIYLSKYLKEHIRFIKESNTRSNNELKPFVKPYIKRFYNRVRHRVTYRGKLSFTYLKIYISYKKALFTI
ncbi:glycosyltransferase family 2 protein [Winogradskyella helgolandensis]|uniref:glycosyltransferase family 2 protein n=1 Tax=Winogradskyella helgolandensis TaxID=2697010 RepID=UPI0015CD3F1C|nr:glycosyltransferase family 2 protein [Winogradskyella helgolandensis]